MSSGKANILAIVVRLLDLKTVLALGRRLDAADDHVGGVRMAEHRIERQRAGDAAHHPADRGVAEILVGDERIDLQEVGGGRFQPLVGRTAGSSNAR